MYWMLRFVVLLTGVLCSMSASAVGVAGVAPAQPVNHTCPQADGVTHVDGQLECLAIQTVDKTTAKASSSKLTSKKPAKLLVYLHGDSSTGGRFDRQFKHFKRFANADTVFVGLMRPGYADSNKNASTGDKMGGGDSYTAHNVDAVANALQALKTKYAARRLVVVGYSGGAATAGVILGRHPALIDDAILIACPCDLAIRRQGRARRSISPSEVADKVFKTVHVTAITGDKDTNTAPIQVTGYIEALQRRGVAANYVEVHNATHDVGIHGTELLHNIVLSHLQRK